MIYVGTIKDNAGNPIPGAYVGFYSGGNLLASFPANSGGTWTLDDTQDGGLLDPGITATFTAPGYQSYSMDAFALQPVYAVTLVKKVNANIALLAGGAAVALLLLNSKKGKRVGATENKKQFSLPPWVVQLAPVAILGGVALYFVNKKDPKAGDSAQLAAAAAQQLAALQASGIGPTISTADAEALSATIVEATDDCGTDEDKVYSAFNELSNDADFWLLVKQFGVRQIKSCFSGNWFTDTPYNLMQIIAAEFSSSNIASLNAILTAKGITYKF